MKGRVVLKLESRERCIPQHKVIVCDLKIIIWGETKWMSNVRFINFVLKSSFSKIQWFFLKNSFSINYKSNFLDLYKFLTPSNLKKILRLLTKINTQVWYYYFFYRNGIIFMSIARNFYGELLQNWVKKCKDMCLSDRKEYYNRREKDTVLTRIAMIPDSRSYFQ